MSQKPLSVHSVHVLVVTSRRHALLERCLESVAHAFDTALNRSCMLVVNGEDSRSVAIGESFRDRIPDLKILSLPEAASPAEARNIALRELERSDWILFLDDDAYLPPDYLARFKIAASLFPDAVALGGPNLTPPGSSGLQRAIGAALSSRFATYLSVARYRTAAASKPCGEEALMLCNLFVRKSCLDRDPFPKDFVCAEENWMLQGLAKSGWKMMHVPELAVFHERRNNLIELVHQVFRYGTGRGQNIRCRPSSARLPHVLPTLCLGYTLLMLWSIPSWHWWMPVLAYPWLAAAAALRVTGNREAIVVSALFPLIHGSYGVGVLWGLLRGSSK